jgi:hypothetical protein
MNPISEKMMDDKTLRYLWALRKINEAMLVGLKTAIETFEKWDDYTPEKRNIILEAMKTLVSTCNKIHGIYSTEQ